MNYDEIRQFQGLTGLESFDEINYWLEMGGKSLENALELYFAHMNMGNSSVASSSSSIRKPDQVKRARLVSEVDDITTWYAPPQDLLTYEAFEVVKSRATEQNKWMLVNIQSETEFACHELNRDFWGNESIKELVKCSFVFWQQLDISDEGGRYVRLYKVGLYPYVGILHPSTGAVVWSKEAVTANLLYDKLQDFIGQHPSPTSYLGSIRNETYAEPRVEHLAQIVPALKASDSFHFIPLYIQPNPSSNPASSSESVRIKIKMTNGHVFLRSFNLDDALMKLIQEVISQISQQDYSKPFDVFYDHPQKSLAAQVAKISGSDKLNSLQLSTSQMNHWLNYSTFRSLGMVFDQVVLVRLAEES